MGAEFDTVAGWTAEVATELDDSFHIPAGCRGSGSPGVLHWFLDRIDARAGRTFLDWGAGVGGPAAFAAAETGVAPVLTDPEVGACRAARALFDLPVCQAGSALPVATGSVEAGWSLGVLCTVDDQAAYLDELRRVLAPNARFGLLVYTASHNGPLRQEQPAGNSFPTEESLTNLLTSASLDVHGSGRADAFAAAPPAWERAVAVVDDELRRRHGSDQRWKTAERQSQQMGRLQEAGEVFGLLLLVGPS